MMFDKQAVDEYRQLTAPTELRQRVMNAAEKKKNNPIRYLPIVGSVAACLALLVVSAVAWLNIPADVTVSTNGFLVNAPFETAVVNAPRTQNVPHAMLTLKANGTFTVETDDVFYIVDTSGNYTPLSSPYRTRDTLSLCWFAAEDTASLTVNGTLYTLQADFENGTVSILSSVQD